MKWLKDNGFRKSTKLIPHHFPDTGRGLMCLKKKLCVGDLIVSIPHNLLITRNTVLISDIPIDAKQTKLNSIELLTAFLIWEKQKQQNSIWFHYIESIPKSFDEMPYFWHFNQFNQFNDIIPQSLISQIKCEINKFESSMKKVLFEMNMSLSDDNINIFKWSFAAVNTRCIYLDMKSCPNDCALAPFLDLLNHSFDAKIKASFNHITNSFEIHSLSPYSKYEQVFINYCNHNNRSLFIHYGFSSPNVSNNSILVSSSLLSILFPHFSQRFDSLSRIEFVDKSSNFCISSQGLDWKLEIFLKLMSINEWFEDSKIKSIIYFGDIKLKENEEKQYGANRSKLIDLLLSEYDISKIYLLENNALKTLLLNEINLLSYYKCISR